MKANNLSRCMLSCDIGEVELTGTTKNYVYVNLLYNSYSFFYCTVTKVNGRYVIYDMRSAIEERFRTLGLSCGYLTLCYDEEIFQFDDEHRFEFYVVYCDKNLPAAMDSVHLINKIFLYSKDYVLLSRQSPVNIVGFDMYWYHKMTLRYSFLVEGSNELQELEYEMDADRRPFELQMSYPEMVADVKSHRESEEGVSIVSVRFYSHGRIYSVFFADFTPTLTIAYRNMFNVLCYLDLMAKVKKKQITNKSEATINNMMVFYDQNSYEEYEVEVMPLNDDQAELINEMFYSHYKAIKLGDNSKEVVITSYDSYISNDRGKATPMKFKFRYSNPIPVASLPEAAYNEIPEDALVHEWQE